MKKGTAIFKKKTKPKFKKKESIKLKLTPEQRKRIRSRKTRLV